MIIETSQQNESFIDNSDVCIIGAGPAGITLAQKLSRNDNIKISIIESGDLSFNSESQKLNSGECLEFGNYPHQNYSISHARIRQFGGTSNVWAGWSGPLEQDDFNERSWIEETGWPISYQDLEPFYKKSQSILNLSKFIYDKSIYDYYPKACSNDYLKDFKNVFWQFSEPPIKFNHKYFQFFKNKKNIKLFLQNTVTDLIKDKNQITEVVCIKNSVKLKFKSKIFVLACGAIENAAILLNFQKKNPEDKFNNFNVGKYFMEHPHCTIGYGFIKNNNNKFLSCYSKNKIKKLDNVKFLSGIVLSDKTQKENRITNCVSVFLPNNFLEIQSAVILRYNLALRAFNLNFISFFIQLLKDIKKIYLSAFEILKNFISKRKKFYIISRIEQVPNKNSRVYLSNTKNKYGNFLPILDWQMKKKDLKTLLINFNEIKLNLEKKNIADVYPFDFIKKIQNEKIDKTKDEWDKNLKKEVFGVGHHMGTTRMGEDKNISVVNSNLKVYEIDNLYCAGSSVFPTCGYINPTLTIVALSLRLAEHLESKI